MFNKIWSLRNRFDYFLRQRFQWRRKGLVLPENQNNTFQTAKKQRKHQDIEQQLIRDYDLTDIIRRGSRENYLTNLYYLSILEKAFSALVYPMPDVVIAGDVGCSSWFYVRALWAFMNGWQKKEKPRKIECHGYEVDAYRPYLDLYSRFDYAAAYTKKLDNVFYHPTAFETLPEKFDIIFQFFPFIFIRDHLQWGLPDDYFGPQDLLNKIIRSLKPGGIFITANQGEKEHLVQMDMLRDTEMQIKVKFKIENPFSHYVINHYLIAAKKNG